jgi:hypothetical protein
MTETRAWLRTWTIGVAVAVVAVVALFPLGCAGRRPTYAHSQVQPPVDQEWRVSAGSRSLTWHAIRLSVDSISGIPLHQRVDCDSCRVTVALTEVDSIQVRNNERTLFVILGVLVAITVFMLLSLRGSQ